jgi:hypothetical protein
MAGTSQADAKESNAIVRRAASKAGDEILAGLCYEPGCRGKQLARWGAGMRCTRSRLLSWALLWVVALGSAAAAAPALAQEPPANDPVAVERIVIRFASGQLTIASRHAAQKVLPPSDELPDVDGPAGFWYEVRSAAGALRYRRILENPIPLVFEGPEQPDSPPGTPASRKEAIPAERFFSLLVPAPFEGDVLVLFSSPLQPGAQAEPASEIARFLLADVVIK